MLDYDLIPGFENYAVSSDGSIWSRDRDGNWKPKKVDSSGCVSLWKNGKETKKSAVQLIALFYPELVEADIPEVSGVEFKNHPKFKDVLVGNDGSVWTQRLSKSKTSYKYVKLEPHITDKGYANTAFSINSKVYPAAIHVLVLETFVGPCPEGLECCHRNGNPSDNRLENLRWGTRASNHKDKIGHGTHLYGSKHGMAKITEEDVKKIKELYGPGARYGGKYTIHDLGEMFGVDGTMISKILTGANWRHV